MKTLSTNHITQKSVVCFNYAPLHEQMGWSGAVFLNICETAAR
jgi:hypothetical protein